MKRADAAVTPLKAPAWLRYVLVLFMALAAVTLFLLATAAANTALFAERYPVLLALNGAIALALAALVGYQLYILRQKLRLRVFGSKLTLRLVVLFALIGIVPGALIYAVSVQFLGKSIESWFEVRIDKALDAGLNLGRNALDGMLKDLVAKGESISLALSVRPPSEHLALLNTLRQQAGVQEATLYTQRGKLIAFSGDERAGIAPESPSAAAIRKIRLQQTYAAIEQIAERGLYLRVIAPVNVVSLAEEARALQLMQPVPEALARDAETVQGGYQDYQELVLSRRGLKRLYGITLTLALLLALLSALAVSFLLSDRLSAPLNLLVEGTRAVAQGDFSQRAADPSRDELGMLTRSFNSMTLQLGESRAEGERKEQAIAHAKAQLESILTNLSAGVLAFDEALKLRSANRSASEILRLDCSPLLDRELGVWDALDPSLSPLTQTIRTAFAKDGDAEWEQQVEREAKDGTQVLLVRGSRLPPGAETGYVVVFDDVTHLLQAQRDAAWAEVARRLAHEIKNPLTPIQLSAERVELKLAPKLDAPDAEMLARATRTIVNQVAALKRMVDAFSQYARTPESSMREFDLNALIGEVLTLYESLGSSIELELAENVPPVLGDPAQLRQVIHNLLQNAQDALVESRAPRIVVKSEAAGAMVRLSISDNGTGFPENLMKRAFEPYVTTKPKGTGLGLVIVKKIVEEHGGEVAIANLAPEGARVTVTLPSAATHRVASKSAA
ncbi:MAG TPA: ATP-binding protein [Burkholderiales bacterium]|nr:ATP-binding protein [Burkholderiales bacterium]